MEIYRDKIREYDAKLHELSKILKRLSWLRLCIFVISSVILIYLFSTKLFTPFFIVFPLSVLFFVFAVKRYDKLARTRKHVSLLKEINEAEILREKCDLDGFETGEAFIDPNHPYTSDLDIFGEHSLFQMVNRTTTESGTILLSEWLSRPASNEEIQERQKAISEVSQKLEWRQDFQAAGMHFKNKKSDYQKLLKWVGAPVVLRKYRHLYKAAAITLPLLFLVSSYFFYVNLDTPRVFVYLSLMILVLITNFMILKKVDPQAEQIVETSTKNLKTLRGYRALIKELEGESFKSEKLSRLQSVVRHGNYSAYKEINRLCGILEFSQQKGAKGQPFGGNQFYPLLNLFVLLDVHLILDTEKWKLKNREFLKSWAEVVSEFEVINSFAGFCYSNPSYTFPEVIEKGNYLHFESMGHPLINAEKRVSNDFRSEGQGNVVMVTGSNMGGKSTFLRTVGVNLVLALAGAPSCATYGQVSNLKLFTSMRTQDNLKNGVSSFYAELSRIEQMLKLMEHSHNVFFLLDEMFKGTNSQDRHRGGFSFINQISKLKTSGIIATHDIELAKLSGNKLLVTNYSFNSEIKDGAMEFSYQLDPGICNDFNASELMERSGIKILSHISESEVG